MGKTFYFNNRIKHQININNKTKNKIDRFILRNIIKESLKILKIKKSCEINLILVKDEFITKLNQEYRGINEKTDILTFTILDKKNKKIYSPDNILHLGDIFISLDTVKKQFKKSSHSFYFEIAIILIHGILHIFGFTHQNKKTKNKMDYWSKKILNNLINKKLLKSKLWQD